MAKHVVVVGGGQGGLSAAVHLALAGHRVLVVHDGPLGGKAAGLHVEGYRLDPGPSIVILPDIYRQTFAAAGRPMDEYLVFDRLDPISRVYFGDDSPIDLPGNESACVDLVGRLFPADRAAFEKLVADLRSAVPHAWKSAFRHPYNHLWQLADPHLAAMVMKFDVRKTYRTLVDDMFAAPLLRAFFYGFPSYSGQTYDSKAPGALMIPYFMVSEGVYYPRGGVAAIPNAYARLAQELGVEFRQGKVVGLETRGKRAAAALLESGEKIDADAFVCNADRSQVENWLGRPQIAPPSLSYFTVHWGIDAELPGLSHHTLLVPKDFERGFEVLYRRKEFPEPPIVYLNATSVLDPTAAPKGKTNLFAVVTTPAQQPHLDWTGDAPRYRKAIVDTLRQFGWDIDAQRLEFERIQSPDVFAARDGSYRGSLYGVDEAHRPLGGLFPARCKDELIGNLFYCGGSVQPGAGLPMVTLSGRFAAAMV